MGQPGPGLRVCSQRAHGAAFGVEAVDDVIGGIHIPEIALRIEAHGMGAYEHRGALAPRAHECAVRLELQHGVIAAIERDDIARGTDGDAAHAADDRVGGIVEKVLHQMEWQLRYRRCATAVLRVHRRNGAKRNRCGANR